MEQIVEKKDKPVIKIFLVIIVFVIIIDFIMFFMNKYLKRYPYITTIVTTLLVVISCSYILIKYFSKYLYTIEQKQLIFYRLIGKRRFEMLNIDFSDLIYIGRYSKGNEKCPYNFTFDKNAESLYIGKFKQGDKRLNFLFSPNENILNELKRKLNNYG